MLETLGTIGFYGLWVFPILFYFGFGLLICSDAVNGEDLGTAWLIALFWPLLLVFLGLMLIYETIELTEKRLMRRFKRAGDK